MCKFEKKLKSTEETIQLGNRLAQHLTSGDVIVLEGDLGAGKTTFTKGIAEGLNICRTINSPTFTIIKEYEGRLPLYHMDVYRVTDGAEDFGFEEYFEGDGITVIEWAHLIEDQLPDEKLAIYLFHEGDNTRRVQFVPHGNRYNSICKEIFS